MARTVGDIEIPVQYTSALLSETVRASLYCGTPSATLSRIIDGFRAFAEAKGEDHKDAQWVSECAYALRIMRDRFRAIEQQRFGGDDKP